MATNLCCRLAEEDLISRIRAADGAIGRPAATTLLRGWLLAALPSSEDGAAAREDGGSGNATGSGGVGRDVNGALLASQTPQEVLLADDRWAGLPPTCWISILWRCTLAFREVVGSAASFAA